MALVSSMREGLKCLPNLFLCIMAQSNSQLTLMNGGHLIPSNGSRKIT